MKVCVNMSLLVMSTIHISGKVIMPNVIIMRNEQPTWFWNIYMV